MADRSCTPAPSRRGLLKLTSAFAAGTFTGTATTALVASCTPTPAPAAIRSMREEWGDMGFLWRDPHGRAAIEHAMRAGVRTSQVYALVNGGRGWAICVREHPAPGGLATFTRDGVE